MNKIKIILLLVCLGFLTGCASYSKTGWYTPDGFSYTYAADHEGFKPAQHYFGLNWSLKDSKE